MQKKLIPYINSGEFSNIKKSGTTLRLYDDIIQNIDFENQIWTSDFFATDDMWLNFIIDNCLMNLKHFELSLEEFNNRNRCAISKENVKAGIKLWMNGAWFDELSNALGIEMHISLRFINSFISFNVQSLISTIIRLKELLSEDIKLTDTITNWSAMLQYGVSLQQELDLFEMGLIDRIAVLEISETLEKMDYSYTDYKGLKFYLLNNKDLISNILSDDLPQISKNKIESFYSLLSFKELL